MTELRERSKLIRRNAVEIQPRPLIVTRYARYLDIRQAKTRTPFSISYEAIFRHAAKLAADKALADRKRQKAEARIARSK